MGLSSSQARLLTLTARMHQIEYKAAKLEAQKLQMANESRRVYDDYLQAIDATKIQFGTLTSTGKLDYTDANYANLIGNNLSAKKYDLISTKTGDKFIPDDVKAAFNSCTNIDDFMEMFGITNRDYISISSAADLMALNGQTLNGNYRLTSDISISGTDWEGISLNGGVFDGNGHTISFRSTNTGVFTNVSNSTVKNLNVSAYLVENEYPWNSEDNEYDIGDACVYSAIATSAQNSTFTNCNVAIDSELGNEIYVIGGMGGSTNNNLSYVNASMYNINFDIGYAYATFYMGNNSNIDHCSTIGSCNYTTNELMNGTYDCSFVAGSNNTITNCNDRLEMIGDYADGYISQAMVGGGNNTVQNCYSEYASELSIDWDYLPQSATAASSPIDTTYAMPAQEYSEEELERFFNIMSGGTDVFTNLINSGEVVLVEINTKPDGSFDMYETSVAINTNLREVPDETLLRKAEAKYEADMRKIDAKDRKYDTDLAALDTERNAIKSEMETLKTVAKDNVERTFKLFS